MELIETKANSATVLTLVGRLDGLSSPGVEQKIDALLAAGARALVLDLARLDYVSSAGLRVFLVAAKKSKAAGGKIAFAALTPVVREVFELSGFLNVLDVKATVAEATA